LKHSNPRNYFSFHTRSCLGAVDSRQRKLSPPTPFTKCLTKKKSRVFGKNNKEIVGITALTKQIDTKFGTTRPSGAMREEERVKTWSSSLLTRLRREEGGRGEREGVSALELNPSHSIEKHLAKRSEKPEALV
jgi:hypothetical protein